MKRSTGPLCEEGMHSFSLGAPGRRLVVRAAWMSPGCHLMESELVSRIGVEHLLGILCRVRRSGATIARLEAGWFKYLLSPAHDEAYISWLTGGDTPRGTSSIKHLLLYYLNRIQEQSGGSFSPNLAGVPQSSAESVLFSLIERPSETENIHSAASEMMNLRFQKRVVAGPRLRPSISSPGHL